MNLQEKEQAVKDLAESLAKAGAAYLVNFSGVPTSDTTKLRRQLRPSGARLEVVKNTLAKRAIAGTKAEPIAALFEGPTAVIWADKDPVGPAKVITDFLKIQDKFQVKGGLVEGSPVQASDIAALAKLPSREQLLAQLLALINAPATQLLRMIAAPASSVVRVVDAVRRQKEEGQA